MIGRLDKIVFLFHIRILGFVVSLWLPVYGVKNFLENEKRFVQSL